MSEFLKEFIYEVSKQFWTYSGSFSISLFLYLPLPLSLPSLQVDWSEPWLLSLLAFHVLTAITILLARHHTYIQAAILAVLGLSRLHVPALIIIEWWHDKIEVCFMNSLLQLFFVCRPSG